PSFLDDGLEILTAMTLEACGGSASAIVRAGRPPLVPKAVGFDPSLTQRLGGVDVPEGEQRRILEALDFAVGGDWQVTCPPRR
ncbi:hypothetical protein RYX45_24335, partial [Alkalihalophilus pseudofirmus]